MNLSFEKALKRKSTNEWYTPKEIIDSLGVFDLDPCAPVKRLWDTAKNHFNKNDDGLKQEWTGRVFLNPPYTNSIARQFIEKLVKHNNGIALLYNRAENEMWHDLIFPNATALLFTKGRIKFYRPDGTRGDQPGCGSVFIAFGRDNAKMLQESGIEGKLIWLNDETASKL